jgi:Cellulose binding domain
MQDSLRKVVNPSLATEPKTTKCTRSMVGCIALLSALTFTTACKPSASTDNTQLTARYTHTTYNNENAFSGKVVLHNTTSKPLTNWTVALPMYNTKIDSVENAGFALNDSAYVFSPSSSNTTIAAHDSAVFTFSGTTSKDFKLPVAAFLQIASKNTPLTFAANTTNAPKGSVAPRKVELLAYPSDFVPTKDIRLGEGRLYPVWEQSSDAANGIGTRTQIIYKYHACARRSAFFLFCNHNKRNFLQLRPQHFGI